MSDLIGRKVFVYIDEDGYCAVFPFESEADKMAVYEEAVNKAILHVKSYSQVHPGNLISEEDVESTKSDAAKQIIAMKLAEQKQKFRYESHQIENLKTLLQGVKDGNESSRADLTEKLLEFEIRLDEARHYGGSTEICEPKGRI